MNDAELVTNYLAGDDSALKALIERYTGPVFNFVASYVGRDAAEDVAQESFIKVWKNLSRYKTDQKFKTWLFQIAKNTAIDHLRKQKIPVLNIIDTDDEEKVFDIVDKNPLPDEVFKKLEKIKAVDELLNLLPPIYRVVIDLYYRENFSLPEIANILKDSLDTVKSRHRRALAKLRLLIEKNPKIIDV